MPLHRQRRSRRVDSIHANEPCPARTCAACQTVKAAGLEALLALNAKVRRKAVDAGEPIFRVRDDQHGLTVVADGLVMLQHMLADGRRQVIGFRYPGDIVNFSDGASRRLQPLALLPGALCRVDSRAFDNFRVAHPAAAERLARLAADEVARMADHMLLLGQLTAAERMAVFLLEVAGRLGRNRPDGVTMMLPMARDDIADYLGISVETVSRQFTGMKRGNLIALPKPDRVVIRDMAALRRIAPFSPAAPIPAWAGVAPINAPAAA